MLMTILRCVTYGSFMSPNLALSRPDASRTVTGNDGLTDDERSEYAAAYRSGSGSHVLHPLELELIRKWRSERGEH